MKTILLSFKPDVYSRIISGEKIYEHRRFFPNEEVKAYLYISRPVQCVTGILYLDNRHTIKDWLTKYSYDDKAIYRIKNYLKQYNYAMEIPKFVETTAIPLEILKKETDFLVPRSYYFIDNTPLLYYLENNLKLTGKCILHDDYDEVSSERICNG